MPRNAKSNSKRPRVTQAFLEAQNFARQIVDDPQYRESLLTRAREGKLSQSLENLLLYYRFGRPVEAVEVEVTSLVGEDLTSLSDADLARKADAISAAIRKSAKPPGEPEPAPRVQVLGPQTKREVH